MRNQKLQRALEEQLVNAEDVCEAYFGRRPIPPLQLRCGITIYHEEQDTALSLFVGIVINRTQLRDNFYSPTPNGTIIDCGAHIGIFSLFISTLVPGARICCVEPCPDTIKRLSYNISANGLRERIAIVPAALWSCESTMPLKTFNTSVSASLLLKPERSVISNEAVKCYTLSQVVTMCNADAIDLLKLDIEGAEVEVLRGVSSFDWERIRHIVVEYHDKVRPGTCMAVLALLGKYGFTGLNVTPFGKMQGVITGRR